MRQTKLPYSQVRIQRALLDNASAAHALVALFRARFAEPRRSADHPQRIGDIATAEEHWSPRSSAWCTSTPTAYCAAFTLSSPPPCGPTFAHEALGPSAPYLVHKLDAQRIDELPHPRPMSEIAVYSPEFEGVHLRFGLVARGGLRWSDRLDDYRTEVLGLVRAQAVKNAMIVPAGAKGVFVVKAEASRTGRGTDFHPVHTSAALLQAVRVGSSRRRRQRGAGRGPRPPRRRLPRWRRSLSCSVHATSAATVISKNRSSRSTPQSLGGHGSIVTSSRRMGRSAGS
jgi:Bacterial NAD-glutamate dehydrogenase